LGRRTLPWLSIEKIHQNEIDIFDPKSFLEHLPGHDVAICTLGAGQPSKMGKEAFVKIDKLAVIDFDRLSIFQPSMIITSNNRYGFLQGILLGVWPLLSKLLLGGLHKYRGIPVAPLGNAIAKNVLNHHQGFETLHWEKIRELGEGKGL
jgi:hypothetical protein